MYKLFFTTEFAEGAELGWLRRQGLPEQRRRARVDSPRPSEERKDERF
ncbi:hypothetical protein SCOR_33195 [Sulfidibacter corallicola]